MFQQAPCDIVVSDLQQQHRDASCLDIAKPEYRPPSKLHDVKGTLENASEQFHFNKGATHHFCSKRVYHSSRGSRTTPAIKWSLHGKASVDLDVNTL